MRIRVDIAVSEDFGSGSIRLSEECIIDSGDFGTVSNILSKFHDVLLSIKARDVS